MSAQSDWLYRNRYLDTTAESVERVGEFDVSNLFHFTPSSSGRNSAFAFEAEVQSWFEGLRTEAGLRELPADLRRAVRMYIDPVISSGTIRAGHPRELLRA